MRTAKSDLGRESSERATSSIQRFTVMVVSDLKFPCRPPESAAALLFFKAGGILNFGTKLLGFFGITKNRAQKYEVYHYSIFI